MIRYAARAIGANSENGKVFPARAGMIRYMGPTGRPESGVFPARAGMIRAIGIRPNRRSAERVPRSRGDDPVHDPKDRRNRLLGVFPARAGMIRSLGAGPSRRMPLACSPARAGMIRTMIGRTCGTVTLRGVPRSRGDDP